MASPDDLLRRLRALPAAVPLLSVLGDDTGMHVVGGAVRDLLLGGAPVDLDLVVEGDAIALARRLVAGLGEGAELQEHERFGTATVRAAGHAYDFAGARSEVYARPGALPDVRPGTLEEDLLRRDFTVNAIAVGLDGRLVAAPGAFEDLGARTLRVVHEASFLDDPTRLLRLVRYATRLGFSVSSGTSALAAEAVAGGALGTVTPARVGSELRLLLREPSASEALAWVAAWEGALGVPLACDASLASRACALLPGDGRRDLLLLALACRAVGAPALAAWLDGLGFSGRERDIVVEAARASDIGERLAAAARPSEIAAAVGSAPVEAVALAGALSAEAPARRWIDELRHVSLDIDGADLLAAGVPQGEAIGRGLAAALRARLDGDAPDRAAQLAIAANAEDREAGSA